ncbi:MAG: hypothetical protein JW778_03505 [Candidatus Altiarchaeota archaeon]|nr:hypothetical protein [Candidatus Altiarchaeota archaeon]
MDSVEAEAYGTGVIVDAGSRGAVFALDLKATASAKILEDHKKIKTQDKTAEKIAKKVLDLLGYTYRVEVKIKNEIPLRVGFGEKEAVAIATALAVTGALAKKHGSVNELRIDKYMKDQFMIIGDKLVDKKKLMDLCVDSGMRLDRTYASLYGGFSVADNNKRKVLRHGEMESLHSIILVPEKPKKKSLKDMRVFDGQLQMIWDEALKGNLNTAMNMNSMLYNSETTRKMLNADALAVSISRKGGLVGFTRKEERIKDIMKALEEEGKILIKKAMNEKAWALIKPKKIYKTHEFLELKGGQEHHWL